MKKRISLLLFLFTLFVTGFAQKNKLYDPSADAGADIAVAIKKAAAENKFVLIQAGGNWCSWCLEFARFSREDASIDSLINTNFVLYHLNFSKENYNKSIFAKYGYPQRFGFPVFLILNGKGERIHTQSSTYLEDGKMSYDKKIVLDFLINWTSKSLAPETYLKN